MDPELALGIYLTILWSFLAVLMWRKFDRIERKLDRMIDRLSRV